MTSLGKTSIDMSGSILHYYTLPAQTELQPEHAVYK